MRLGVFTVADTYPELDPAADDRLLQLLRLAGEADEAGLDSFWVAEHHFHHDGVCPSPPVLLAACAAGTRRIRLGSLVSVLPFHRPVELAEEYAIVDRLSGGRLNLGVGSGYLASELEAFGVPASEKRERFEAALAELRLALGGQEVRAGGAHSPAVRLNVRPVQRPSPPFTVAVQRREALPFLARQGLSVALIPYATVNDLSELADEVREYREALPATVPGSVAAAVHVYVGEEPDRARVAFRRYVTSRISSGSTYLVQKAHDHPDHASPQALEERGLAAFGSSREVSGKLDGFARAGIDEVLAIVDFGNLAEAEARSTVRALGKLRAGW